MARVLILFKDLDRNLSVLTLFALILLVLAQIIARVVFSAPLVGTEELVKYFLICIVFFAGAYTARTSGHIRMEELISFFPTRLRVLIKMTSQLLTIGIMCVGTYSSFLTTARNLTNRTATLSIPFWIFFLPNNVGFLLMTIQYAVLFSSLLRRVANGTEVL